MKSVRFCLISFVVLITFTTASLLPLVSASAQGDVRGTTTPTLKSPHGTILDTTPAYKWTVVSGATSYQYQVWKGSTKVLDKTPDGGICGSTFCVRTPAVTLGYNVYKWRVRAYKSGVWSAWSAYRYFTVSPPSFDSQFNGTTNGWVRKGGGTWSIRSDSYLYTMGLPSTYTSAYKTSGQYTDFDYSVRVFRYGTDCTWVTARMGNKLYSTTSQWYPGYWFGYCNDGKYAIIKSIDDGDFCYSYIQEFTPSSYINKNGWNIMRVWAKGSSFKFYINGHLLKSFTDSMRSRGYVGVMPQRGTGTLYTFYMDWAILNVLETVQ